MRPADSYQRPSVRLNILANYVGGTWAALIGFAFVPLYIRYMGVEAYGLVGFFSSMLVWLTLLDMGISSALSREIARYTAGAVDPRFVRTLFNSLEIVYLAIASVLGLAVVMAAPWIAAHWLRAEHLPIDTVERALVFIGAVVALRWACALYRGVLIGAQRQVWLSTYNGLFATLRSGGVVLVLMLVAPTIEAFFLYQAIVGVVELAALAIGSRLALPRRRGAQLFSLDAVKRVWHFAGGMAAISALSILLTQVDKVILSALLPLSQFGYYMLAYTAAGALHLMITPVGNAAYPRLTELATRGSVAAVASAYHAFCQSLTLVIVPIALTLALFSEHVLLLWTQDQVVTAAAAPLFALLLVGNMLNGLMYLPYNLQLAHGWTIFMIKANVVALMLFAPLVYFGVAKFGVQMAAVAWILLNAAYLVIAVPLMHRKLLPAEKWRWYRDDVIVPSLAAVAAVGFVRALAGPPQLDAPIVAVGELVAALSLAFLLTGLSTSRVRSEVRRWLTARS